MDEKQYTKIYDFILKIICTVYFLGRIWYVIYFSRLSYKFINSLASTDLIGTFINIF